jgi:hypothetical protein
MENNIQINKNTLLIVSILLVVAFFSSVVAAYQMGVNYGEETIIPMTITPTPIVESIPPAQTDPVMPLEEGSTMPGEQGQRTPMTEDLEVACTMEAKICPDGSSVGRMPPNCEFAPCPGQ